ncbi:MAG: FkbM family methyltransferase [Planctomycetota bacterium]
MFRQINNLRKLGRFRTLSPMWRVSKPKIFREHPSLEITSVLDMVIAKECTNLNRPLYFVQIGAFDGKTGDPLFKLVKSQGWNGILVEPQPDAFKALKANYDSQSGLQFFQVAVGPENGQISFYTRQSGEARVASTQKHLIVKPGHAVNDVEEIKVPCWTFDKLLCEAEAPQQIDLLQIDAEGFDFEIIKSIDFEDCRPTILRFEHVVMSAQDTNDCLTLLADQGYRFLLENDDTTAILQPKARSNSGPILRVA